MQRDVGNFGVGVLVFVNYCKVLTIIYGPVADPREDAWPLLGPKSSIFMQLSAKILQNNRLAHPLGKSSIRHCGGMEKLLFARLIVNNYNTEIHKLGSF